MTKSKIRGYLDVATSVAVILGAAVVIYVGIWGHYHGGTQPNLSVGLRTGSLLTIPSNIHFDSTPNNLIIAMNTKCGYCRESIPFYKQLAELQNKASKSSRVIALFPNSEGEVKQFLQQNNLMLESSSSVDFGPLKITGTPTLILVDANGKIRDFWIGKLTPDQEQQVIKAITAPAV